MMKQVHAFFSGRVQGVGFRFTVEEFADEAQVLGWVKNLKDGRVEVVAEADEEVLQGFLERISEYFSRYISDVEVSWGPASSNFKNFSIGF